MRAEEEELNKTPCRPNKQSPHLRIRNLTNHFVLICEDTYNDLMYSKVRNTHALSVTQKRCNIQNFQILGFNKRVKAMLQIMQSSSLHLFKACSFNSLNKH